MIRIQPPADIADVQLHLKGSKSISNRHLILNHLLNTLPVLKNLSDSEDTELLQTALLNIKNEVPGAIDIRDAGTDMRFLTALLCITPGEWQITGSQRMKERPVKELVTALRHLGAEITCTEREGFPPLKIKGKKLKGGLLQIDPGISSQFVSALLLIAPFLEDGLTLDLTGKIVSRPYIDLTVAILKQYNINAEFKESTIKISPYQKFKTPETIEIESDWSSASYWFSVMALLKQGQIKLTTLHKDSPQADSVLSLIYSDLGVTSHLKDGSCILTPGKNVVKTFDYDFSDCPDIALTVAVTCFGLGIACKLSGLKTLLIKESNRVEALCTELKKAGANIVAGDESVTIAARGESLMTVELIIDTYNDHRMAMSFAPLSLLFPGLIINNHGVVRKSYPSFWNDLKSLGFSVTSQT